MKYFLLACFFLVGCSHSISTDTAFSSIHIIDRNGFTETISSNDRLKIFQANDFLSPQPYKKVTRTFKKDANGKTPSMVTTYHANGQLWQYLEVLNGRAHGTYQEFFPTGQKRLEATVIEGEGDLTPDAQDDWVFDGKSLAWNESGHLIAEIAYQKGFLDGPSIYYQHNKIERTVPYSSGKIHGTVSLYNENGKIIGTECYSQGKRDGICQFQGQTLSPPYREKYRNGYLIEGTYFDLTGQCIAEIRNGEGEKVFFKDGALIKKVEHHKGVPNGQVKLYTPTGKLHSEYPIIDEKKHGEEWIYHENSTPKMLVTWYEDEIHGTVKTWFSNGTIESQREICHNQRQGHSFAWYADGSIMFIEDYENGRLTKGSYMKKGSKEPISKVKNGQGFATLHDANGFFLKKIEYKNGKPVE